MKRLFLALAVSIGIVGTGTLRAQNSNEKLVQKLVDKNVLTQDEANQLLSSNSPKPANKVEQTQTLLRKGLNNSPYLNFGGYGMLLYQYNSQASVHNDMRARVVYLWMEGKLNEHFRYFIMPELVSATLYEYYAEWMPSNKFKLRGGEYKIPFTLEMPISLVNLESVNYSRTVSALTGMSTDVGVNNGGGRDLGIQASGSLANIGSHDLIQYAAGLFQGTGINKAENNNVKDFAGTLTIQPVKGWRIAGGLYAGQSLYTRTGETTAANHVRNRWALSSDYKSDIVDARAEYVKGNDAGITREGVYGVALCHIAPKTLDGYVKAEHYNNDKSQKQTVNDYSAGLSYYFAPLCRFQLNYQYSDYSSEWTSKKDAHSVFAELQLYF